MVRSLRAGNSRPPSDSEIAQRIKDRVYSIVLAEVPQYKAQHLCERMLTLPVLVALVLNLIWRQIPGVCTLHRMVNRQGLLWVEPQHVSQSALSLRFRTFPTGLFGDVMMTAIVGVVGFVSAVLTTVKTLVDLHVIKLP